MSAAQPDRDSRNDAPSRRRGGPTVLRIALGAQLRKLREANGISRESAGEAIRASHAKISRLELGRGGFKERDVADLLTLYGIRDEQERETFLAFRRFLRTINRPIVSSNSFCAESEDSWHTFATSVLCALLGAEVRYLR